MSYIIDALYEYLIEDGEKLKGKFQAFKNELLEEVGFHIVKLWNEMEESDIKPLKKAIAVDGSIFRCALDDGGSLVIVSSYLAGKDIFETSKARCAVIYPPSKSFGFILMRTLELELARQAISVMKSGDVLLLDGSLYGIMCHLPLTPTGSPPEYGEALINFYDELTNLLIEAEQKKITLISISKSSSSRFMKEYILEKLYSDEVRDLRDRAILEPKDLQHIETLPHLFYENPAEALEILKRLMKKYGTYLKRLYSISQEFVRKTPDLLLLKTYTQGAGFTYPILLGPSLKLQRLMERMKDDIGKATLHYFKIGMEYANGVRRLLENMFKICSICSFYIRFSSQDYPLKVDVPSYVLDINDRFFEVTELKLIKDPTVRQIVYILREQYVNREIHNVWLYEADRKTKITRKDREAIYQILLKTLGQITFERRMQPIS
ncbi:MAG: DNA double-strand break repair nuclease NurA [Nitrososphaerota archaeon]